MPEMIQNGLHGCSGAEPCVYTREPEARQELAFERFDGGVVMRLPEGIAGENPIAPAFELTL